MQAVRVGFVVFLVSVLLAVLLSQWLWLEMRVKVGMIIPLFILVFIPLCLGKGVSVKPPAVLLLQLISVGALLFMYRFQWRALLVVPATLVREGLWLTNLSLAQTNGILILVLLLGNLACVGRERRFSERTH